MSSRPREARDYDDAPDRSNAASINTSSRSTLNHRDDGRATVARARATLRCARRRVCRAAPAPTRSPTRAAAVRQPTARATRTDSRCARSRDGVRVVCAAACVASMNERGCLSPRIIVTATRARTAASIESVGVFRHESLLPPHAAARTAASIESVGVFRHASSSPPHARAPPLRFEIVVSLHDSEDVPDDGAGSIAAARALASSHGNTATFVVAVAGGAARRRWLASRSAGGTHTTVTRLLPRGEGIAHSLRDPYATNASSMPGGSPRSAPRAPTTRCARAAGRPRPRRRVVVVGAHRAVCSAHEGVLRRRPLRHPLVCMEREESITATRSNEHGSLHTRGSLT